MTKYRLYNKRTSRIVSKELGLYLLTERVLGKSIAKTISKKAKYLAKLATLGNYNCIPQVYHSVMKYQKELHRQTITGAAIASVAAALPGLEQILKK